jgi:hypothetical protein
MSSKSAISRRLVLAGLMATPLVVSSKAAFATEALPKMVVTKDPLCGCCTAWVEHIRAAGFSVEVTESTEINRVKARLGIPQALASCHTAEIGGYVIEGHVPAPTIKRLLAEKPEGKGLAVPGMPAGAPGMEVEGMEPEAYEVVLFGPAGQRTFARFKGSREV